MCRIIGSHDKDEIALIAAAYERFTRLRERLYEAREQAAAAQRGGSPCVSATEHVRTSAANG